MHIKLEINAESVEEFDAAVSRFAPRATLVIGTAGEVTLPAPGAATAEAETPALKKRAGKGQTAADTAGATAQITATSAGTATEDRASAAPSEEPASSEPDGHPLLVAKTLADVKALGNKKVGELGAGPVQQALADNFGVKAFGGLDPADYDRAYAVLEVLK
jgi:hypothetical protein